MRYLGVDYGTKRVGIAISDETNKVALPLSVLKNSKDLLKTVLALAAERAVTLAIIGQSTNFAGADNPVMKDIRAFAEELVGAGLKTEFEPEFMTSAHAERIQGRTAMLDASAAALILQSYLDRLNTSGARQVAVGPVES